MRLVLVGLVFVMAGWRFGCGDKVERLIMSVKASEEGWRSGCLRLRIWGQCGHRQ